ncbi:formate dehydrogenase subunit delta [Parasphingopyxis lamellibrachiae]|nr:formate dehydrogenase subunit delta [Parasphingopyxis lamellibrachiae]
MANQIARNFATLDDAAAANAIAAHIVKYWDPRMRVKIIDSLEQNESKLLPVSRNAVAVLRDTHQSDAP